MSIMVSKKKNILSVYIIDGLGWSKFIFLSIEFLFSNISGGQKKCVAKRNWWSLLETGAHLGIFKGG